MANRFLVTDDFTNNRHQHLEHMITQHNVDDIPGIIVGLDNVKERLREEKWTTTKTTIIACVALKRKCGGQVGVWLAAKGHPKSARLTELCKWSAAVYRDWDFIVHVLSEREMGSVNPKDYSLRNLYDVRGEAWRKREKKRNARPKKAKKDLTNQTSNIS